MDVLINTLHHIADEFCDYVNFITTILGLTFRLATSVGALIVETVKFLLLGIVNIVSGTITGSLIVFEDFGAFLVEVSDTYAYLHKCFADAFQLAIAFIVQSIVLMITACSSAADAIASLLANIISVFCWCGNIIKHLIILVGDGTLLLLQLVPWSISVFFSFIISTTKAVLSFSVSLPLFLLNALLKLVQTVRDIFSEIPIFSYIGLAVAVVLTILVTKFVKSSVCRQLFQSAVAKVRQRLSQRPSLLTDSFNSSMEVQESEPEEPSTSRPKKETPDFILRQLEREQNEKLCIICQDEQKSVILLPCRHLCLCQKCQNTLIRTDPTCPICRSTILDTLRVYV